MNQDETILTLDRLQKGQTASVVALTNVGPSRRRFLDLGILPGTQLQIELKSPLGDPTAYRVRGAVIALRREQASQIQIVIDKEYPDDSPTHHKRL